MNFDYKKNCLTCEFGFDNISYDENWDKIFPNKLIINCTGNDDLYGKEVNYKSICEHWTASLKEFTRCEKGIGYYDFYQKYLELLDK